MDSLEALVADEFKDGLIWEFQNQRIPELERPMQMKGSWSESVS